LRGEPGRVARGARASAMKAQRLVSGLAPVRKFRATGAPIPAVGRKMTPLVMTRERGEGRGAAEPQPKSAHPINRRDARSTARQSRSRNRGIREIRGRGETIHSAFRVFGVFRGSIRSRNCSQAASKLVYCSAEKTKNIRILLKLRDAECLHCEGHRATEPQLNGADRIMAGQNHAA